MLALWWTTKSQVSQSKNTKVGNQ